MELEKLKEMLERYDVSVLRAGTEYIILFTYSPFYGRYVQERFVGETLEKAIDKAYQFFKKKQNAGYYIG
jgi:hypothetical protein